MVKSISERMIKKPISLERLAEIAARFEAARPKEDRGGEELMMTVLPMKTAGTRIHHADGELAAIIYGDPKLNVNEYGLAKFFAHALVDVRDLLEEIKRVSGKKGIAAVMSEDDAENLEWHEIHDDANEARRIGEVE